MNNRKILENILIGNHENILITTKSPNMRGNKEIILKTGTRTIDQNSIQKQIIMISTMIMEDSRISDSE